MRNKLIKNFILILMILFMTLLSFSSITYAITDVIDNPDHFYDKSSVGQENELKKKANTIVGVINAIGIVISVITVVAVGIKYMLGSVEEKAEYKKSMGFYILGAFLIFGITTVPNIIYKFASNV